jgi:antitoxin component YwqK of YwqJK toxin-antitoxin module
MRRKKSIKPLNDKDQRNGYWEYYYKGNLIYKCFYQNGKEVGYEECYDWCPKTLGRKIYYI